MAVDWYLEGVKFGNCSCDYSCPCQFEALPTNGACRGIEVLTGRPGPFRRIAARRTEAVLLYAWPGPIHDGNGSMQAIIDERADPAQRAALSAILHGEETREGATHWWVFRAMSSAVLRDPVQADRFRNRCRRPHRPGGHSGTARGRGSADQEFRSAATGIGSGSIFPTASNSRSRKSAAARPRLRPRSRSH